MPDHDPAVDEFDLAGLDSAYQGAPDEDAPVPDGRYTVTVEQVQLKRSQTSGSKMLEWELRLTDSVHAGRKIWKYTLLETPEQMTWAKRDFRAAGLELEKLSDLPSRLGELLDRAVEVTLKTRDDSQWIYFRSQPGERPGASRPARPGDRPF